MGRGSNDDIPAHNQHIHAHQAHHSTCTSSASIQLIVQIRSDFENAADDEQF